MVQCTFCEELVLVGTDLSHDMTVSFNRGKWTRVCSRYRCFFFSEKHGISEVVVKKLNSKSRLGSTDIVLSWGVKT